MQNKQQLKKLKALWERKLLKSGLVSVERPNGTLINFDSHRLRNMNPDSATLEARQRYYELARQFFNDHYFDTAIEKEVWRLHSEGFTIKEIVKKVRRMSWSSVQRTTKRLAILMLSQRVELSDRD